MDVRESTENKIREVNILEDSQSLGKELMDLYSNVPAWKVFLTSSASIYPFVLQTKKEALHVRGRELLILTKPRTDFMGQNPTKKEKISLLELYSI